MTNQLSTEVDNSSPIEYIKNDVAKQTGVVESVASIEIVDNSASSRHSGAIVTKHDGSTLLYMWGRNDSGQLGDGSIGDKEIPTRTKTSDFASPIKQVVLGAYHSAVVLADGSFYMWGDNAYGQLGTGDRSNRLVPERISAFDNMVVSQVFLSLNHSAAILADGSLYMWGNNYYGQLGTGDESERLIPERISAFNNMVVSQVTLGDSYSAAVAEGGLYTWGSNGSGELGTGDQSKRLVPERISAFNNMVVSQVSIASSHSAAVADGNLYTWGSNSNGKLGTGDESKRLVPERISAFNNMVVSQVSLASNHSAAVADGNLYTWGKNNYGQLGDGMYDNSLKPKKITIPDLNPSLQIKQVVAARNHSAVLLDDGSLYMRGANDSGQLRNTLGDMKTPQKVEISKFNSRKLKRVSLGLDYSAALLEDGSIYTWGRNNYGQLGNGTFTDLNTPTWMPYLGKDSHITANPTLTSEQAVNNSWVNGKFKLDGFKQSFNLINVLDVPDQTIDMVSKPVADNKNRSVTINMKIKYFYDENGLRRPDDTVIPLTITGFAIPFVDSSITLKTSYTDPTDYGFTAKQLESNLKSATLDAKITRLKKYIDFDLKDQPDGSKATITAISTTSPVNKSGELQVTFSLANFYENGSLVTSKTISIINLRKTSTIIRKSSYATETAKLLTSQFITNLEKQITPTELKTFLTPYLDMDFPTQGSSHNNQASITSATAKETTNGTIELVVQLADYYDDITSDLVAELKFSLDGFIKTSSIKPKKDYGAAAAIITVHNLISDLTASNDYKTLLSPYLEFDFNTSSTITSVTTTNTTDEDKANGIFKFSLGLANYYEATNQVTSKDFTLNGFIRTSSITKKSVPTSDAKNISVEGLVASLATPHSSDQYIAILEPFLDFKLATQSFDNKSATIKNVTTSNVNETLGSLTVTIELNDFYINTGKETSLSFNLTGLALSSSITKKIDADVQAASMTIKNLQDKLVPGADYQTILAPFLVFNFTAQTAPNEVATISNVTFDNKLTNSANGELGIILHLDNYLEDGILVPTKTFALVGFKKVSSITIKTGYKKYAVNTTAKELASKISTAAAAVEQQARVLNNYLSFQLADTMSSMIRSIAVISDDDELSSGILQIEIFLTNFYDEHGALVTSLKFGFEDFNHFHFNPREKPLNGRQETPEQVLEILLNGSDSIIDNDNLSQYVDLNGLTPNSLIVITRKSYNPDGSLTLYLSVDNYYFNDILMKDVKDFTVHLTGLKPSETSTTSESGISWWIYVGIGVGVLLLLIVFILLIKKRKQKDKRVI